VLALGGGGSTGGGNFVGIYGNEPNPFLLPHPAQRNIEVTSCTGFGRGAGGSSGNAIAVLPGEDGMASCAGGGGGGGDGVVFNFGLLIGAGTLLPPPL
jgi:hypothetical protein